MKNGDARFAGNKYPDVGELAARFNLSFSSQLVLGNKIIALDGLKKRLFVLETREGSSQPYIIDLKNVAAVTVKKSYGSIKHGELKNKGIEDFLKSIDLQFEFADKSEPIVLSFYDCGSDNPGARPRLDRNAKNWQLILSKLIGSEGKTIQRRNKSALVPLPFATGSKAQQRY